MKPIVSFEIFRWIYFFLFWLISMGIVAIVVELAAGPALRWLFYDMTYQLPTWNRVGRMALFVFLFSLFAGSVTWMCEKKLSDR